MPDAVAQVFDAYPPAMREKLLELRHVILETAAQTEGVGPIDEALRWGQPSYLTSVTKSGSTVRLGRVRDNEEHVAVFFNCQTALVQTFRQMYANLFTFERNRALQFHINDTLPVAALGHCIAMALRYHLDKAN
ncbi:MAG: DUF1801 domain-containing protein [Rhodothermales bacterium]